MPKLDHSGPEGNGPKTGRQLGKCHKLEEEFAQNRELGKGMGQRRNSGGGRGKGYRLKANIIKSKYE